MLFEKSEHISTKFVEIGYPRSINDFLKTFQNILIPNFQDGMYLEFELKIKPLIEKEVPLLQIAKLENAKEITEIFKDTYDGTYPYKEFEDEEEVFKMIKDSNFHWILFKIESGITVGCFGAHVDLNTKKGTFHGLAIKKKYQKKVDVLKGFIGFMYGILHMYKDRILVWSCEMRTAFDKTQYMGLITGLNPIAFLPNKDIFFNKIESDFLHINYDKKVLRDYRSKKSPKIIRKVLNCYAFSNKKYHLGIPIIENPNIKFKLKTVNEIKNKVKKKIVRYFISKEIVIFTFINSDSYFKFSYNPVILSIENTEYKISKIEELFVFIEKLKEFMKEKAVRYFECFISSYKPIHQKIFYDAGFRPRGYVPCWKYNKDQNVFEDHIVFNYYEGKIDKNIKLIPESLELLKIL